MAPKNQTPPETQPEPEQETLLEEQARVEPEQNPVDAQIAALDAKIDDKGYVSMQDAAHMAALRNQQKGL